MSLIEIFFIFIMHYIADFIFQAEKWALGKSKNNYDLLTHTTVYSILWFWGYSIFLRIYTGERVDFWIPFLFFIITFVCHTITDYYTSRVTSKLFHNKKFGGPIPNFGAFSMIGFDQVLHYIQLFLTYQLLK